MISEIYNRSPQDINYRLNIETNDEIESILGQIKMILGTKPTEVLGTHTFGLNLNQYLFNFGVDTNVIKTQIISHFTQFMIYDKQRYHIDIDIKYGKDHNGGGDYALIDISINQLKCLGVIVSQ